MTAMDAWLYGLYGLAALGVLIFALGVTLLLRSQDDGSERIAATLREELRLAREESSALARQLREDSGTQARALREEIAEAQVRAAEALLANIGRLGTAQKEQLDGLARAQQDGRQSTRNDLGAMREEIQTRLQALQTGNEQKLEEMRRTVDEKLQGTLEKRLGESFKLVSERLEAVQRGLGEMKNLADGVGDLKRVLTNVKERGTWGEYQLAAILEQVLSPDQYAANVRPKQGGEVVEFAIRLPGRDAEGDGTPVWLPIDAKFPREDYERLLAASEAADAEAVRTATAALAAAIKKSARDIHTKYIDPPATTDFAILFLPTEGLYAEVLRQPGLADELRSKFQVLVAGPTTLAALLNSLRVGFRTLAIEKRSHEVWNVLGAVKTEFGKFGEVLDKVKRQLASASNTIEDAERRTRVMTRKLKNVEQLGGTEAAALLGVLPGNSVEESGEETEDIE